MPCVSMTHLHKRRVNVMNLNEERQIIDRKLAVHGVALSYRLVVAYGNTRVEVDALGTRYRYLTYDIFRSRYLHKRNGRVYSLRS
jgi:hypothetical protein